MSGGAGNRTLPAIIPTAQVGEDREHAATRVARRRKMELLGDARDVLLVGALGDDDTRGNRDVREALGHQLEDVARATEVGERILSAPAADQLRDDRGIERRAARGNPAHGRGELRQIVDAVLEQIADAIRAILE